MPAAKTLVGVCRNGCLDAEFYIRETTVCVKCKLLAAQLSRNRRAAAAAAAAAMAAAAPLLFPAPAAPAVPEDDGADWGEDDSWDSESSIRENESSSGEEDVAPALEAAADGLGEADA